MFRFEPPKSRIQGVTTIYWRPILQTFSCTGRGGLRLSPGSACLAAAEAVNKVSTLGEMKIFSDICLSTCNSCKTTCIRYRGKSTHCTVDSTYPKGWEVGNHGHTRHFGVRARLLCQLHELEGPRCVFRGPMRCTGSTGETSWPVCASRENILEGVSEVSI